MPIFGTISFRQDVHTIATAVNAVVDRALEQRLLPGPWSLAELKPDEEDYMWLTEWATEVSVSTFQKCLIAPRMADVRGRWSGQGAGIGLLVMLLWAETARRDATGGALWPALQSVEWQPDVDRFLFANTTPSAAHQGMLEMTARGWNLRHVFGVSGVQHWFDTIFLQVGFTRHGLQNHLPRWLAGHPPPVAVQSLLKGSQSSDSFRVLWGALQKHRTDKIESAEVRRIIHGSPWVQADWAEDLLEWARRPLKLVSATLFLPAVKAAVPEPSKAVSPPDLEYPILTAPLLRWEPPASPLFVSSLTDLQPLGLTEPRYQLLINGQPKSRLNRQENGIYFASPSPEFILPCESTVAVAQIVDEAGQIVHDQDLALWPADEDVSIFSLTDGRRLQDAWNVPMRADQAYVAVLAADLTLNPPAQTWDVLNPTVNAHLLPQNWPSDTAAHLDGVMLWSPKKAAGRATGVPPWCVGIRVLPLDARTPVWGGVMRLRVTHPSDVSVAYAHVEGSYLDVDATAPPDTLIGPLTLRTRPGVTQLNVILGLTRGKERARVRQSIPLLLSGVIWLTESGWECLPVSHKLTLEEARRTSVKIFPPPFGSNERWALMEGDTFVTPLWQRPRPIGDLAGLGSPLTVRPGPYNAPGDAFMVVHEVIDEGVVADVAVETTLTEGEDKAPARRLCRLTLRQPLEPDASYRVLWWQADRCPELLNLSEVRMLDEGRTWCFALPSGLDNPVAVGLAYQGTRIGAWWRGKWSDSLDRVTDEQAARIAAIAIRWLRLPLLGKRAKPGVRRLAAAFPAIVLTAWLRATPRHLPLEWPASDRAWLGAIRRIFRNWQPDVVSSKQVIGGLAPSAEQEPKFQERVYGAVFKLIQIDPFLMAKVIQSYLRDTYLPSAGLQKGLGLANVLCCQVAQIEELQGLAARRQELLDEVAGVMKVDPAFVERALIRRAVQSFRGGDLAPTDEDNLSLACDVAAFRQFLSINLLETVAADLGGRR